ncbi:GntR family transcriptional regulator [Intrasporangium chromatireducens Q5-1]|uniref:GntR family transcriptional regulator n=1 Tax=Intrasporangium chromatireducens Q5-1 TaxID=584657 RepID=W9GQD5_9MICO|nr:FCD domain-containing protein [Intrasporangium chromatireducens]EWT06074.1 GntR family transcriptional regulator [Intrasporangium chromatireducens Q5-1]
MTGDPEVDGGTGGMTMSNGAVGAIGPVDVPKASEIFADILRDKILRGEFPQGESLPPERTLVEQSGLSRAAVRDSLAILKQQGLIVTKTGRNGGSVVSRPTPSDLVSSLEIFLQSHGWDDDHPTLRQMREILEPWCAAFAAADRTDADLDLLHSEHRRTLAAIDNTARYLEASKEWHNAVVGATHNVLLSAFMQARGDAMVSSARRARYDSRSARQAAIDDHARICAAIEDRDPRLAYDLMTDHVRGSEHPLLDVLNDTAQHAKAAARQEDSPLDPEAASQATSSGHAN